MKPINYRASISLGSGDDGTQFVKKCDELARKLGLLNQKREANYSALFKYAVEELLKRDTQAQNQ